jgi:hypothetical protein
MLFIQKQTTNTEGFFDATYYSISNLAPQLRVDCRKEY